MAAPGEGFGGCLARRLDGTRRTPLASIQGAPAHHRHGAVEPLARTCAPHAPRPVPHGVWPEVVWCDGAVPAWEGGREGWSRRPGQAGGSGQPDGDRSARREATAQVLRPCVTTRACPTNPAAQLSRPTCQAPPAGPLTSAFGRTAAPQPLPSLVSGHGSNGAARDTGCGAANAGPQWQGGKHGAPTVSCLDRAARANAACPPVRRLVGRRCDAGPHSSCRTGPLRTRLLQPCSRCGSWQRPAHPSHVVLRGHPA